jgi:UDP-3-O-acyl-N-acetylglucosamine deacetylase
MALKQPLDCKGVSLADGIGKLTLTPPDAAAGLAFDKLRKEAGMDDRAPAESMTTDEYAERFGVTHSTANTELKHLVAAGKLKVGRKPVTIRGRMMQLKAYWPA